jgi:hypothetical protein
MTDEDAAKVDEGLEVFGFAFVAADQAAIVHQPGQARLHDPPVPTQALRGLDALASDAHRYPAPADLSAQCPLVVGLVRVQFHGPLARSSAAGPDRSDRVQQRQHQLRVGGVGSGDEHGEGNAPPVTEDVDLRSGFAAVDRVWPGQFPLFSARTLIESTTARDQSISLATLSRCRNC